MKVTIGAFLPTKRNMNVNTRHGAKIRLEGYLSNNKEVRCIFNQKKMML